MPARTEVVLESQLADVRGRIDAGKGLPVALSGRMGAFSGGRILFEPGTERGVVVGEYANQPGISRRAETGCSRLIPGFSVRGAGGRRPQLRLTGAGVGFP